MNRKPHLLLALALACLASPVLAGAEEDQIRAALTAAMPQVHIDSITKLPYAGLYEVVVNRFNVFYTNSKGEIGTVRQPGRPRDPHQPHRETTHGASTVDFSRLPLDKAIVKVKGDGSRKLAIFTDPDCPYCKRLEKELSRVSNVTVYIFLFPLAQLHPDAPRKATAIWCAPDRIKAWDELMLSGHEPPAPQAGCDTPIADIARLGQEINLDGTPGLIFSNGKLVPGAISAEDIEKLLNDPGKS